MPRCLDSMNMMNFKIQAFFTTLIIGTVSALTISDTISQKVNAQVTPTCNNATITGSYGSQFTGEVAAVGLVRFNGSGSFQGTDTINSYGTVSNRTVSGTYSVTQNCTVQIVYRAGSLTGFLKGTIVSSNKEILVIQTNPSALLVGTFKKVN